MTGVAVLLLFALWLLATVKILKFAYCFAGRHIGGAWAGRLGVALAVLIIAFLTVGDEIYGRYRLKKLCEREAGVKLYRTVNQYIDALGFVDQAWGSANEKFKFMEHYRDNKLTSVAYFNEVNGEETIIHERNNWVPKSRYFIVGTKLINKKIYGDIRLSRYRIVDNRGAVLLESKFFYYEGGVD